MKEIEKQFSTDNCWRLAGTFVRWMLFLNFVLFQFPIIKLFHQLAKKYRSSHFSPKLMGSRHFKCLTTVINLVKGYDFKRTIKWNRIKLTNKKERNIFRWTHYNLPFKTQLGNTRDVSKTENNDNIKQMAKSSLKVVVNGFLQNTQRLFIEDFNDSAVFHLSHFKRNLSAVSSSRKQLSKKKNSTDKKKHTSSKKPSAILRSLAQIKAPTYTV